MPKQLIATKTFNADGLTVQANKPVPHNIPAGCLESCLRVGWIIEVEQPTPEKPKAKEK